jgi:aspartate ammonia-lyase
MAAEARQLQLNVFEPIIAYRLLRGMIIHTRACDVLRELDRALNPEAMTHPR